MCDHVVWNVTKHSYPIWVKILAALPATSAGILFNIQIQLEPFVWHTKVSIVSRNSITLYSVVWFGWPSYFQGRFVNLLKVRFSYCTFHWVDIFSPKNLKLISCSRRNCIFHYRTKLNVQTFTSESAISNLSLHGTAQQVFCWGSCKKCDRLSRSQRNRALLSHVWQSGDLLLHSCLLHTLVSVRNCLTLNQCSRLTGVELSSVETSFHHWPHRPTVHSGVSSSLQTTGTFGDISIMEDKSLFCKMFGCSNITHI